MTLIVNLISIALIIANICESSKQSKKHILYNNYLIIYSIRRTIICYISYFMDQIKKQFKQEVEMKVIQAAKRIGKRLLCEGKVKSIDDCPSEVKTAIHLITQKMEQSKIAELHPPFLPKTITKYRHEYFLPLKKQYHNHLDQPESFKSALNILSSFILHLDYESFDIYLQQIRQPYIRKMFNENYQFDKIDFKEINNEYKIRNQIQNLLNSASQWLLQIEKTQDLLERIQLYFDIRTPIIIEKAKKEGVQSGDKSWMESFSSLVRNVSSYTLRKSSKIIQSSFFTAVAPAAAILTLAIIGGTNLPWKTDINSKLLIAPAIAITVPYLLDGLAEVIERKQFINKLEQWAITLEQIGSSIAKFNEQLQETIFQCCSAANYQQYQKVKINLEKYVKSLNNSLNNLTNFDQSATQEMRDRTEAYFKKYVEIKEGQWTVVIPQEQYQPNCM